MPSRQRGKVERPADRRLRAVRTGEHVGLDRAATLHPPAVRHEGGTDLVEELVALERPRRVAQVAAAEWHGTEPERVEEAHVDPAVAGSGNRNRHDGG